MSEYQKMVLFPIRQLKEKSPHAIGTLSFSQDSSRFSVNLFNMPQPKAFSPESKDDAHYQIWFYDPTTTEKKYSGTLTSTSPDLYSIYDRPYDPHDFYPEAVICVGNEEKNFQQSILLIGYLYSKSEEKLKSFEPFSPMLPNHKWWKLQYGLNTGSTMELCRQFCWYSSNWPTSSADNEIDLPQIIGYMTNQLGEICYLIHGIPGRFRRQDQPAGGQTGYFYWHPYYGFQPGPNSLGYWLCYLDPKTNSPAAIQGVTIPEY